MLDLTAIRMFYLEKVADEPFSNDDEKALAAVVLEYAYATPFPEEPDKTRLTREECIYLLETFGYDVGVLQLNKRQFLTGLLPNYSMASKHPLLVGNIFKMLMDPEYRQKLVLAYDETHPPEPMRSQTP